MLIYVTDTQGVRHELQAESGWRVMEIIRDWQVGIKAECGGCCLCATCHVYVDDSWIERTGSAGDNESAMLDIVTAPRKATSRLSCQITASAALDGLVVHVPAQ